MTIVRIKGAGELVGKCSEFWQAFLRMVIHFMCRSQTQRNRTSEYGLSSVFQPAWSPARNPENWKFCSVSLAPCLKLPKIA